MRFIRCLFVFGALAFVQQAHTQTLRTDSSLRDSSAGEKPVQKQKEIVKDSARLALERLPKVAIRRALLVPGWGQITNHKLWKLPLVYGGYVALGLVYNFEQQNYRQTLHEVQYRLLNDRKSRDPELAPYSFEALVGAKDYYRRNRDLCILGFLAWHSFQAIEAYVDAKMLRYDVSPDLSLRIEPALQTGGGNLAMIPVPSIRLALVCK